MEWYSKTSHLVFDYILLCQVLPPDDKKKISVKKGMQHFKTKSNNAGVLVYLLQTQ